MNFFCVSFRCWRVNQDPDASNEEMNELLSFLYCINVEKWKSMEKLLMYNQEMLKTIVDTVQKFLVYCGHFVFLTKAEYNAKSFS